MVFSFSPPMGSTRPRSVTSPVMATSPPDLPSRQGGEHGGGDGDAGGGAVLGHRPLREVDVDVLGLVEVLRDAQLCRTGCAGSVSAAWADSFITSPRLPVSSSLPEPSMTPASTSRISPPTSVQARPLTTPT